MGGLAAGAMPNQTIDKNDMVAMGAIWNDRILVEEQRAREWEPNWGFLSAKAWAEAHGGKTVEDPRASLQRKQKSRVDPSYELTRTVNASNNTKKFHLCDSLRMPQDKFDAPRTESHKYGWGANLERYGVAEYGMKHVALDWPAPDGRMLAMVQDAPEGK